MAKTTPIAAAIRPRKAQSRQVWRCGSTKMALQQKVVAAIGLPGDVEGVSQQGNGAHQHADAEVDRHASQRHVRNSAKPSSKGDDQG